VAQSERLHSAGHGLRWRLGRSFVSSHEGAPGIGEPGQFSYSAAPRRMRGDGRIGGDRSDVRKRLGSKRHPTRRFSPGIAGVANSSEPRPTKAIAASNQISADR
jgi:hypothetical protein